MRNVLTVFFQFALFLITFLVGSLLLHPFHVQTVLASDAAHVRSFQWDGVLLMATLYLLVLTMEAVMKKLRTAALASTIAVALAGAFGLMMKFGFVSVDR